MCNLKQIEKIKDLIKYKSKEETHEFGDCSAFCCFLENESIDLK